MSELGEKLIKGLNECLEYEQGKRHDLRTFTEVVYCKDCKHWDAELECCTSYTITKCSDGREGVSSDADDFCSRGKRRDDNEDKH